MLSGPKGARMSTLAADQSLTSDNVLSVHAGHAEPLPKLMLGAIGVVYGDIGTSPLYTMKESFLGPHPLAVDRVHILGVLSLIFWSLMLVVTAKYVFVAMRADNKGEGGSFALLSLISRNLGQKKYAPALVMLGVLATCLFYGDAMITPAISVLSAVEGLTTVEAGLSKWVVPIALVLLIGLFFLQKRGTTKVGTLFAPTEQRTYGVAGRSRTATPFAASRATVAFGSSLTRPSTSTSRRSAGVGAAALAE